MNDTLQENEKWYRSLLDQAADAFHILDAEGRIVDVNAPMCESLGYTREELLSMRIWELDPSWTQERYTGQFSAAPVGAPFTAEAIHYRKDGSTFPVETRNVKVERNGSKLSATFARDISERKRAEAERERLQQEVIEAQRQALRELSTPIIPVMEGIIVMPLVGSIDTMRSKDIMRTLMQGISAYRAKVVILDITGVPLVDSGVADHLNKTIQAARLKGTRTIVTGISDAVAETIVDLGIDWGDIETLRDLQTGLVVALGSLGFRLSQS